MPTLAEILAAKSAAPSTALKITPESEKAALARSIKKTLDATAPPPKPGSRLPFEGERELGGMEKGEQIPMDHPKPDEPEAAQWFNCLHSFESEMGIVIEPEGNHAWVAVVTTASDSPALLLRLPLLNRQGLNQPF